MLVCGAVFAREAPLHVGVRNSELVRDRGHHEPLSPKCPDSIHRLSRRAASTGRPTEPAKPNLPFSLDRIELDPQSTMRILVETRCGRLVHELDTELPRMQKQRLESRARP